jgi:AraC-like DNA-binding protein
MDARIEEALRHIDEALSKSLSRSAVASAVGLSASRFAHLFGRELGMGPAQYIKRLRLETAKRLLANTDLSVKEISARVGLNDVSHFVRDFVRLYRLRPSEYRKRAGETLSLFR